MYIMTGIRPKRPNHPNFTESLWALTQRCWGKEAQDRPEMWEVIEVLKGPSAFILHLPTNAPLTNHLRTSAIKTLPTPVGGSPTTTVGPPTTKVPSMTNADEGRKATRCNVENRQPRPTPTPKQPPSSGSMFPNCSYSLTRNRPTSRQPRACERFRNSGCD